MYGLAILILEYLGWSKRKYSSIFVYLLIVQYTFLILQKKTFDYNGHK